MAYLDQDLIEGLAGNLPMWSEEHDGIRFYIIGSREMGYVSFQFLLRENESTLNCSLAIWGNEIFKKRIVEVIKNEFKSHYQDISPKISSRVVNDGYNKYVFDVYTWMAE